MLSPKPPQVTPPYQWCFSQIQMEARLPKFLIREKLEQFCFQNRTAMVRQVFLEQGLPKKRVQTEFQR